MRRIVLLALAAVLLPALAFAAETAPATHGVFAPDKIEWKAGPPSLAAGAKFAVLEGDPSKEGLFTMRLWLPNGFQIKPHWHPAVEHVTVVSGTFHVGMGDAFDAAQAGGLSAGSFAFLAPKMHHFAWAEGDTVVQVHGIGPWQINYLNPADDPRTAKQ